MLSGKNIGRVLSAVLAASTALNLGGCSGSPASSTGGNSSGASNGGASSSEQAPASSNTENPTPAEVSYPLDTNAKFTFALETETQVTSMYTGLSDTPFGQALAEQTGVDVEYQYLLDSSAFSLLFASGDLPDIIQFKFKDKYAGGVEQAIMDKVIVPINDYLTTAAPDYYRVVTSNETWHKAVRTSQGDYYGFAFILGGDDGFLQVTNGAVIRDDWCRELGIGLPETPSEVYQMLKLFKEKKGATSPFSYPNLFENGYFTSWAGIPYAEWYKIDEKVGYGAYTPEMKEVYLYLNKLYSEGLIDPNYATLNTDTYRSNFMNGVSGMQFRNLAGGIATYIETMRATDPDWSCTGGPYLVADDKKGTKPMSGQRKESVNSGFSVITSACKDVETAVKFLNYGYTDAGHLLYNFGIEDVSYEMKDNKPIYTEEVTKNPEGLGMQYALAKYCRAWGSGPFIQDIGYGEQYNFRLPEQKTAVENWANTDADKHFLQYANISSANAAEYANIMSEVKTYVEEMQIKFVTGQVSIEEEYDNYMNTLKNMNIEKAIAFYQEALDEFNSR